MTGAPRVGSPVVEPEFRLWELSDGGLVELEVRFKRAYSEEAELRIVEHWSEELHDLVLRVILNGKTQMILPEGETPWFFDRQQLEESIRKHGARQTLIDVLEYLVHPIAELRREVSE